MNVITRFFSIALMILMTAALASSQSRSNDAIIKQLKALRADKTFGLIYDKASNNSKIIGFSADFGKAEKKRNNLQSFRFGLAVNYAGDAISSLPDVYHLTFQAGTKKALFKDAHRLTFMIDGARLDLGEARYGNKNEGVEYLNFVLNRKQMLQIAVGLNVKMKLGSADFILNRDQIEMFINLLAVADPVYF